MVFDRVGGHRVIGGENEILPSSVYLHPSVMHAVASVLISREHSPFSRFQYLSQDALTAESGSLTVQATVTSLARI